MGRYVKYLTVLLALYGVPLTVLADPVSSTPRYTFAGNIDFVVTGGTLRAQSNAGNSCALVGSDSSTLSGIPPGATVTAAYLYWAGSGSTPDNTVNFAGSAVTASRTFSENYSSGSIDLDFFSGFADVTSRVSGNGSFSFSGLSVDTGGSYCGLSAVLSGWGLVVVYEHTASPLRVINIFDGFQSFRGQQIVLTPNNFVVPPVPIDGKMGVLTWEGDVENSAAMSGFSENLVFDGQSVGPVNLTDGLNPVNNQYNSTINVLPSSAEYGVDFDVYDISSRLRAGDTSAQTTYASGADLVILSAEIISTTNTPVADLALSKSHTGDFSSGATNSFQLDVSNNGPSLEAGPVTISDTLPAGMSYQGFASVDSNWSCSVAAQDVTCTHPGPLNAGASLATLDLLVDVTAASAPSVVNTATVAGSEFDPFTSNNVATDTATVLLPDLSTSTKTVVPVGGYPVAAGDTLRYTITLNESNNAAVSGVSVTDSLDALLVNLNVIDAGGGTDNSSGTTLQIDDLSVPAGGSVTVVFEADVAGGAAQGDRIANVATVTNPGTGGVENVASPDVTIGNVPTNGIKHLYLGDIGGSTNSPTLPLDMSRTPLSGLSSPVRVRIRRQDDDRVWALTPALQDDLSLDGSAMPVHLYMRRNNQSQARTVRVTLSYQLGAATTFIGCEQLTLATSGASGLVNSATREFVFNVQQTDASCNASGAGALTIPQGAQLLMQVDNYPSGGSGRAIYVYPVSDANGDASRVELPATTVINVDSTVFYDAAFPAGSAQTGFAPNQTVFIRSVVSDPFGSFDISSVSYQLLDPGGTPVASGLMPQVQDSGLSTATYEVSYALGPAPASGNWTVQVTANEGSEGTVSHSASYSFLVTVAELQLEKEVSVLNDPVTLTNNPKAIPQALLEYVVRATNSNSNATTVDTVVIADTLPAEVRFYFGTPIAPVQFVEGSPGSGLTYSFGGLGDAGDDIRFSNDGGTTFVQPSVDANGLDTTLPPINYFEVTPQGTFAPDSGAGSPSFEIRYRVQLQ